MDTSINTSASHHIEYLLSRGTWLLIEFIGNALETMRRDAAYRRAQAQLESLDDRHLRDLGIHRSDIPLAVRGVAQRRIGL